MNVALRAQLPSSSDQWRQQALRHLLSSSMKASLCSQDPRCAQSRHESLLSFSGSGASCDPKRSPPSASATTTAAPHLRPKLTPAGGGAAAVDMVAGAAGLPSARG